MGVYFGYIGRYFVRRYARNYVIRDLMLSTVHRNRHSSSGIKKDIIIYLSQLSQPLVLGAPQALLTDTNLVADYAVPHLTGPFLMPSDLSTSRNITCHKIFVHARWDPCHHSMARPRVADGEAASSYGG
jgi:hypothetical protein